MSPKPTKAAGGAGPRSTAPARTTRRQASRHRRESRLQRIALVGVGAALLVAILIPLYGYWREVLAKGDQPVALVHGRPISTALYARYLGFQELLLERQLRSASDKLAQADQNSPDRQSAQLAFQLLQQRAQLLPEQAVDELIEAELVREEAARRGSAASQDELDTALRMLFSEQPAVGQALGTGGSAAPTLSLEQAGTELKAILDRGKLLTEDEVRGLVLEPSVLKEELTAALSESAKTTAEQVRARHILVDDEAVAADVRARLDRGEDFAAVAKELSRDPGSKDKGGELGWFPRGQMVPEFEAAAFSLQTGEISQPIKTSFGYHLVQVEEKATDRPLDSGIVRQQRSQAFDQWLAQVKAADPVGTRNLSSQDRIAWASNYVARQLSATP